MSCFPYIAAWRTDEAIVTSSAPTYPSLQHLIPIGSSQVNLFDHSAVRYGKRIDKYKANMANAPSSIQPAISLSNLNSPTQLRKRRSTIGQREESEPRKNIKTIDDGQRSIVGKDVKLKSGTMVQDVPSSASSRLSVDSNLEDNNMDEVSDLVNRLKLTRQEREERLIGDEKRVKLERCSSCSAWISKESQNECKICGRDPRPTCSCGAPVMHGGKCEDCRNASCVDWLQDWLGGDAQDCD